MLLLLPRLKHEGVPVAATTSMCGVLQPDSLPTSYLSRYLEVLVLQTPARLEPFQ